MPQSVPYWHVDAFAAEPFSGNQAAVMILEEWPDDSVLQAIGEENNFAETAFLVKDESGEADWQLRWFTPAVEIRLCGHATLAAGAVLLQDGSNGDAVRFRTRKAGILEVRRTDSGFAVALPAIPTEPETMEANCVEYVTPLSVVLQGERHSQVRAGLSRLRELDRETLEAFYVKGHSLIEMSDEFDAPLGTIKRRLHVARKRLAKEVEPMAV